MKKSRLEWALRQTAYLRLWPRVPTPPNIIHIEPSGGCNLKCVTCPQSVSDKKPASETLMQTETFDRILEQSGGFFKEMYFAAGGEPLMHPGIARMVEKAHSAGLKTTLHTNATLLNRAKSVALIEAGLDRITLNILDSKEEYEKVRRGAKFEPTLNNIKTFLEVKKEMGKGPFTTLQAVKPDVPGGYQTEARMDPGFLKNFDGSPPDRVLCFWAHHFAGDFEKTASLDYSDHRGSEMYYPCQEIWIAMLVAYDGGVRPCCIDIQGVYALGNIYDNTLRELWNSRKMTALRRELAAGGYATHPLCRNCAQLWNGPWQRKSRAGFVGSAIFRMFGRKIAAAPGAPERARDGFADCQLPSED